MMSNFIEQQPRLLLHVESNKRNGLLLEAGDSLRLAFQDEDDYILLLPTTPLTEKMKFAGANALIVRHTTT